MREAVQTPVQKSLRPLGMSLPQGAPSLSISLLQAYVVARLGSGSSAR